MTVLGGAGVATLAACDNSIGTNGAAKIDARVNATLNQLYATYPEAQSLAGKATGMLVMPLVTEAGLGIGGSYGRGALLINGATVDYYSQAKASFGLQAGAQQYDHVLFFMTQDALGNFRYSPGWVAGANIKYAVLNEGDRFTADTLEGIDPIVAIVFAASGLLVGATVEGSKYTRIVP